MKKFASIALGASLLLSPVIFAQHQPAPGDPKSTKKTMLEYGASMVQSFKPLHNFSKYFTTIHSFSDDTDNQSISHGFCADLSEDFSQSILYDSNEKYAKIIGVEYTISQRLYDVLPEEEKILWHPNSYQVKGGLMTAPRVPQKVEDEIMKMLVNTYAKTVYTWNYKDDILPIGVPSLMTTPTENYEVNKNLLRERDRSLGIDTEELREARNYIPEPYRKGKYVPSLKIVTK